MTLFNNKYRIETTRLHNWDYGLDAPYFITVCTKNREHYFGEVHGEEMVLNETGIIVQNEWLQTPSVRPDMKLVLDEFMVMPNHFHAVIHIGENAFNAAVGDRNGYDNKFGPQSKNLASVMRGFKSSVSGKARIIIPEFNWQERYHDHIIRNEESYIRIRQYIINNPKNWKEDKFYSVP